MNFSQILSKNLSDNPDYVRILTKCSNAIGGILDYCHFVSENIPQKMREGDWSLAHVLIFRTQMENFYAIEGLLKQSSIDPIRILLRTILETLIEFEFLVGNIEERSKAYIYCEKKLELDGIMKISPGTSENREFLKNLVGDKFWRPDVFSLPSVPQDYIDSKNRVLQMPEFQNVRKEFNRISAKEHWNPAWYSLFGGPKTIKKLAESVKLKGLYFYLYSQLSPSVHGKEEIGGKLRQVSPGFAEVYQITLPTNLSTTMMFTLIIGKLVIFEYVSHICPQLNQETALWFKSFQSNYKELYDLKINIQP
jgi:hypothetical protein